MLAWLASILVVLLWRRRVRWDDAPDPADSGDSAPAGSRRVMLTWATIALAVRLVGLGSEPIDSQEFTYLVASEVPRNVLGWFAPLALLFDPLNINPHLPLLSVINFGIGIFDDSFWAFRLVAAVAGAACVPLLWEVVRRQAGRPAATAAAGLLLVSPMHVWYSQTIAPYTLLTALVLAAYLIHRPALAASASKKTRRRWVLAAGFASWTHVLALPMLLPLVADGVANRARRRRFAYLASRPALPLAIVSLGLWTFLLVVLPLVGPMAEGMGIYPEATASSDVLRGYVAEGIRFSRLALHRTVGGTGLFIVLALSLAGIGLLRALGLGRGPLRLLVVGLVLTSGLLALGGLLEASQVGGYYYATRRVIPLLPAFFALVGLGSAWIACRLARSPRGRGAVVALLTAPLLVTAAGETVAQARRPDKPDVAAALDTLRAELRQGDGVAVGPYLFFDSIVNAERRDEMPTWYQAVIGGRGFAINPPPPRGDPFADASFYPLADFLLPWDELLSHVALKRLWLVTIDETPLGYRETLGPGTVTPEAILGGRFVRGATTGECPWPERTYRQVVLSCFERGAPPKWRDRVEFGRNDYSQVLGFPDGAWVPGPSRLAIQGGTVLFDDAATARSIELLATGPWPGGTEVEFASAGRTWTVRATGGTNLLDVPFAPSAPVDGPLALRLIDPRLAIAAQLLGFRAPYRAPLALLEASVTRGVRRPAVD